MVLVFLLFVFSYSSVSSGKRCARHPLAQQIQFLVNLYPEIWEADLKNIIVNYSHKQSSLGETTFMWVQSELEK